MEGSVFIWGSPFHLKALPFQLIIIINYMPAATFLKALAKYCDSKNLQYSVIKSRDILRDIMDMWKMFAHCFQQWHSIGSKAGSHYFKPRTILQTYITYIMEWSPLIMSASLFTLLLWYITAPTFIALVEYKVVEEKHVQ